MELIFWTSVGLSIVAVISVVILIIKFYNPNPLRMIPGILAFVFFALVVILIRIIRNIFRPERKEARRIKRAQGRAKIIDVKDISGYEYDHTFSEQPYNPYEMYN
jgi:hypothetical protein